MSNCQIKRNEREREKDTRRETMKAALNDTVDVFYTGFALKRREK